MNSDIPQAPDPDELVKLVEFEIKRCDDQKRESGINPWLLYAAIAGLLWQAASTYSHKTDWPSVATAWALAVVIFDIGSIIFGQIGRSSLSHDLARAPRFYSASKILSGSRRYLLGVGLQFGFAAIVVLASTIATDWKVYVVATICAIQLATWLLIIVITFIDIPMGIPTESTSTGKQLFYCTIAVAQIVTLAVLLFELLHTVKLMKPDELRLALLGFALGQVFIFLVSHQVENPLRQNLISLRRTIGLMEIKPADAAVRLNLILFGSQLTEYLQAPLQSYLDASENMKKAQNEVTAGMDKASEILRKEPTEEVLSESSIAINETEANVKAAALAMDRLESSLKAFEIRATFALAINSRVQPEVDALRSRMQEDYQKVKTTIPEVEKSVKELLTAQKQFREKFERKLMNL